MPAIETSARKAASSAATRQNGLNESFNGKFRDECSSADCFASLREARDVIESYRRQYSTVRPHSSLGYRTPHEFKSLLEQTGSTGAST